jgi:hypothetical protein
MARNSHALQWALTALLVTAPVGCASPGGAAPASAPPAGVVSTQDVAAVIGAMDRLFDAMRARDTAAIRALSHPELRVFVPGDAAGTPVVRVTTIRQFMDMIGASTEFLDERAIAPEVRIDGNLASIWTYYEFHRNGEFSHCGTDALHFARTAGGWQIIGLAYTTQRAGCRGR